MHPLPWLTRLRPLRANLHRRVLWAGPGGVGSGWTEGDGSVESQPETISLPPEGSGRESEELRGRGEPAVVFPSSAAAACPSRCGLAVWPPWKPSGRSFGRICRREPLGQLWPLASVRKLLQIRRWNQVEFEMD